jgi:hypothetical protein
VAHGVVVATVSNAFKNRENIFFLRFKPWRRGQGAHR